MEIGKKGITALLGSLIMLAVFHGITLSMPPSIATTPRIYIDPPTVTIAQPVPHTVEIKVQNVTDLFGWEVWLRWDPNKLNFTEFSKGPFLPDRDLTFWLYPPRVNLTEGTLFTGACFVNRAMTVSGSGTLAQVTFDLLDEECPLDLYYAKMFTTPESAPVPPYLGDTNGDMQVDILDDSNVGKCLGKVSPAPGYRANCDFNKDGIIELYDLLCTALNFGRTYPYRDAVEPVEIYSLAGWTIPFKWLDKDQNPVWLESNVTVSINGVTVDDLDFSRSLGMISFNFTSLGNGYCNVSIPKLLMDGAFKVKVNDTETASILTWNSTHTFVCFAYPQGAQNITIVGEIVTRIRSLDISSIADVNGDGKVNIVDVAKVAVVIDWNEDR